MVEAGNSKVDGGARRGKMEYDEGARPKSETPLSKIVHVCNPLGVHNKNQPTQGSSPVQERPPYVDNHLGDHGHTRDR